MYLGLGVSEGCGLPQRVPVDAAGALLEELKTVHGELMDAVNQKERTTRAVEPNLADCALVRWNLSRARHCRRKLMHRVHARLLKDASPEEAAALRRLDFDELQLCQLSAEHLQNWTNERLGADWLGYRQASTAFSACLRQRIRAEVQTLYPMLEARSR